MTTSLNELRRRFRSFPAEYGLAPLWYWNDDLAPSEILRQLREMKRQNVYEAMIFPMAGLIQPYLGDAYFDCFRYTLAQAKKLGMRIWVYDEYCWPSGLAGGIINEKFPEYLMTACRFHRYPLPAAASRSVARRLPQGRILCATAARRGAGRRLDLMPCICGDVLRWEAPAGAWDITLAVIRPIQHVLDAVTAARWTNNLPGYLDVMNRDAVAKYVELVYDAHYRAAPEYYGTTMRGYFTDEPGIWYDSEFKGGRRTLRRMPDAMAGAADHQASLNLEDEPDLYGLMRTIPWTYDLPHIFHDRYGYDPRTRLLDLAGGAPSARPFARDFMELASNLFAENFCEQIGRWCARHKVAFSGHFGEHIDGGDHYKQVRPQQTPGIDLLGGQKAVLAHAELPRKVASIARIHGRRRVLCETYGITPWNFELSDKIATADLLTALGINLHAPIDYAYSFRGFRKHTANPPGFFQASNWEYQRCFSAHTARFAFATSAGRATVSTAILHPTEAALSNTLLAGRANALLDHAVKSAFKAMLRCQIESDIVFDTALPDMTVARGAIAGRGAAYRTVILPGVRMLSEAGVRALGRFVKTGGRLIVFNTIPTQTPEGRPLASAWAKACGVRLRRAAIEREREIVCGRGALVLVPDPARVFRLSGVCKEGEPLNLIDGSASLMCLNAEYPHWIAVDLGAARDLASVSITTEDAKRNIKYAYEIQVSADGRNWRTAAKRKQAGKVQTVKLSGIRTRHLRLVVTDGGGEWFGLHDLDIRYRAGDGAVRRWLPPGCDPLSMAALIPDALPVIRFYEDNRPATRLALNARRIADATLLAVVNTSGIEAHMEARVAGAHRVEAWDLDTGSTSPVLSGADAHRAFPVTFAPWQARVFVLCPPRGRGAVVSLDRRRAPVTELAAPWAFEPARENAFPLAAGALFMADPLRPDTWLTSNAGRIPEPLRFVSRLLFKAEFEMTRVSGKEELLFEEALIGEIAVNGQTIAAAPRRNRYLDAFGLSVPVGRHLQAGKNIITGAYAPEIYERVTAGACYRYPKLQPSLDAFLLGRFSVLDNRIVPPATRLDGRPWQEQGYPYYSGAGIYRISVSLRHVDGLWLETQPRKGVCEVAVNGRSAGVRPGAPYLFDLRGLLKPGRNDMEIRVTNATGTLLRAQKSGFQSRNVCFESGLECLRLVRLTGGAAAREKRTARHGQD